MTDYVKLVLDELLRYRLASAAETEGFRRLRHNVDLCPRIERQLNTYLDCSLKYQKVAYDVQGPRDKGSDVVLRYGDEDDTRYIVLQVKSYDDLNEKDYLSKLKAQAFEIQTEYAERLTHLFIVLCVDALRQTNQLRNIKKDFGTAAAVTVVHPSYAWTFLRLTPLRIDAVVEAILKQEDAVYSQARKLILDMTPLETAALLCLLACALESGSFEVRLDQLRSVGFLDDALALVPDLNRDDFFYDDFDEDEGPPENRQRDADERVAEALDAMDTNAVTVGSTSDLIAVDYAYCEPLLALMLDAKVRFGFDGSTLARYEFEALQVPRTFDLELDGPET